MKKLISILFLLSALSCFGAFSGANEGQGLGDRAHIVTTARDLTNAVFRAIAGDWIIVPPGPTIHILTNRQSFLRPGVNYQIYRDIVFGVRGDGGTPDSGTHDRPIFNDDLAATTNVIWLAKSIICSNRNSDILRISNSATRVTIGGPGRLVQTSTNTPERAVVRLHSGYLNFNGLGEIVCENYDGIWVAGSNNLACVGKIGKIEVLDTAVEVWDSIGHESVVSLDIDFIKWKADSQYFVAGNGARDKHDVISTETGPVTLRVGAIDLGTNGFIGSYDPDGVTRASGITPTIICPSVYASGGVHMQSARFLNISGPLRMVGTTWWATNSITPPLFAVFAGLILENNKIVTSVGHTNSLESWGDIGARIPIEVVGTLNVSAPLSTNIVILGGTVVNTNTIAYSLTADDEGVPVLGGVTHIALSSDNGTAGNRTFALMDGAPKQIVTLEWVGTNAGQCLDASAPSANHRLSATWTPTQYDTLVLQFNGTDWIELYRSTN